MEKKDKLALLRNLGQKRKAIDLIDRKLLNLLNRRLRIALATGKIKRKMGEKIYHPKREKEVLERLSNRNRGPLQKEDLKKIFSTIMRVCRRSQNHLNTSKGKRRHPSRLR